MTNRRFFILIIAFYGLSNWSPSIVGGNDLTFSDKPIEKICEMTQNLIKDNLVNLTLFIEPNENLKRDNDHLKKLVDLIRNIKPTQTHKESFCFSCWIDIMCPKESVDKIEKVLIEKADICATVRTNTYTLISTYVNPKYQLKGVVETIQQDKNIALILFDHTIIKK